MSGYRQTIANLKREGVCYRAFINEYGEMVVRYNDNNNNYTEEIFDGVGKLIDIITVQDNETFSQNCHISTRQEYKNEYINYFAELQAIGNLI
jgi:hypothetical protein